MAQRVFLVNVRGRDLERVAETLKHGAAERRRLAADLAEEARPHLLRAAISERVASAAGTDTVPDSEHWSFARNCLPYLMAVERADGIVRELEVVSRIESESALVEYFEAQVELFGLEPGPGDAQKFSAPKLERMAERIEALLEQAATLRASALVDPSARANFAISTWIWLARIFVRLRPAFWQGRNRWLGNAAFPGTLDVSTQVTSIGGTGELDPTLEDLIRAAQAQTRSNLASTPVKGLDRVLVSVADLAPSLQMRSSRDALPPGGDAYLASGAVPFERMGELRSILRALRSSRGKPYPSSEDWIEIVDAAAGWAERTEAHLVEADDAFPGAYRWPLDELD